MMKQSRDVTLNIGKGVYTVSTRLDDDVLLRVKAVIAEACGELNAGALQEELLAVACMRLAYEVDAVTEMLKGILSGME